MILTLGVPQDFILGPLLFLIYIYELPEKISKISFNLYADDSNFSLRIKENEKRSLEIQSNIKAWFLVNNLVLNEWKTNKMIFVLKDRKTDIETQEYVWILGVTYTQYRDRTVISTFLKLKLAGHYTCFVIWWVGLVCVTHWFLMEPSSGIRQQMLRGNSLYKGSENYDRTVDMYS